MPAPGGTLPNLAAMYARMFGLNQGGQPRMLPQGIDFQAQASNLAREQARAEELSRAADNIAAGQEVSGHYVPNYGGMIAGLGKALMGGYSSRQLAKQAEELAAAQQQAGQDWLAAFPKGTAGHEAELPSDVIAGPPSPLIPKQAASPDEIMQWAARGNAINPTLAAAVTNKVVGDVLNEPEKEAERQLRREQQAATLADRREARLAELEFKREALQQRSEDARLSVEQRREAAQLAADTRREIAQLVAATKQSGTGEKWVDSGRVDPVTGAPILYDKNDPTKTMLAGAQGTPDFSTATSKSAHDKASEKERALTQLESDIDKAIAAAEAHPKAWGGVQQVAGMMPTGAPFAASLKALTPEEQAARGKVAELTAAKIKERYGTAFSGNEKMFASQYLPSEGDSQKQALNKLREMKKAAQSQREALRPSGGSAPAAGGNKSVTVDW